MRVYQGKITLLDFFVHPALFWLFGRKDAEHRVEAGETDELDAAIHFPAAATAATDTSKNHLSSESATAGIGNAT